ncbi:hypothetical protein A0J48_009660 [Sphaerospermopsis aphanizomenoides BCCUSP55]|uniref:hypothetical protein n=1 Tax=Sphaerospermopsis aphanizomenoides TaxID=459663 RepID=UPI001905502B|nr:hypothetical protein [Sphaerospermopsis aphanizomenoides]MBK1987800.1 hypothetical protein [Sphaerospermopsis aphanizomenoides BCCUSP55]
MLAYIQGNLSNPQSTLAMQQLPSTTPQPQHENRYPDCLYMELQAIPVNPDQIDLPVTMHFNEQWEPLLNGRVKFGVKGGQLKLKLKNCKIPYDSHELTGRFVLKPAVCQVTTNGSKSNPTWEFELSIGARVLIGSLQNQKLGTVQLRNKPCSVEATFEVSQQYVHLMETEGLYPTNISRNKQIILEASFRKYLLESKLQPYLSRAELHYG